jgi:hypothetical protein
LVVTRGSCRVAWVTLSPFSITDAAPGRILRDLPTPALQL